RGLSAGGYFEYHGQIFDFGPVKIAPVPSEPIPVLIGGHGDPALPRPARGGDGGLHGGGGGPPGPLRRPRGVRRPGGAARPPVAPFEVHVIWMDAYSADGVRRLEEQGVTDAIVGFRWPYRTGPDAEPLAEKIGKLRRFAEDVIAKVS